ncbi:MAG: hypothetical protein LUC33_00355 [Prevotellaceae bacterium]|nr:hypothetical protein [Prevotellaceae bacterium]
MKKFLKRLCLFALIIVVCDLALGRLCAALLNNARGRGETKRMTQIANEVRADVLVFGSSRALNHYDPEVLREGLGMSAYNCGFSGCGIVCAYGYLRMAASRHCPKVVIYEVMPRYDTNQDDNHRHLKNLRYFYDREGIDSIFWRVDKTERLKMLSQMYRYNSSLPDLLVDCLHPPHIYSKGYHPIDEEMAEGAENEPQEEETGIDSLKLYYLERLIRECKGRTRLFLAVSPTYETAGELPLEAARQLCAKYGVTLLDHSADTTFSLRRDYFYDNYHLNRRGATAYTRLVASEIKEALKQ